MERVLSELFESKLPELVAAARFRIRCRLKDVKRELALRELVPLTYDQARQWVDDIVAQAVCDHWEAYCHIIGEKGPDKAIEWLDKSSLSITRRLAYSLVEATSNEEPFADYYITPEAAEILGKLPARWLELKATGASDTQICIELYGSDNSRNWALLHHVKRQAAYRLEVAALVASVVDRLRNKNHRLRSDLAELRQSVSC